MNSIHLTENQIIEKIIQIIKDHLHPRRIILFGSRSMGTSREYSDFDIAVESEEMDIRQERILKEALDNTLGIYTIDLINLKNVDDEFKNLLLEKGKVIYEH